MSDTHHQVPIPRSSRCRQEQLHWLHLICQLSAACLLGGSIVSPTLLSVHAKLSPPCSLALSLRLLSIVWSGCTCLGPCREWADSMLKQLYDVWMLTSTLADMLQRSGCKPRGMSLPSWAFKQVSVEVSNDTTQLASAAFVPLKPSVLGAQLRFSQNICAQRDPACSCTAAKQHDFP